jgi:hypothetical protein
VWFDAKAALEQIKASKVSNTDSRDQNQTFTPISGNSEISSGRPSTCKTPHLKESDAKQSYNAVKAAFDEYYSLDKFSPDAW